MSRTGRSKAKKVAMRRVPLWFAVSLILSIPGHILLWGWFASNGQDFVQGLAAGIVSSPDWLTSILYFPLGIVALAITEFLAMLPLNVAVFIFGLRQQQALRGSKHFISHRGGPVAH